ncbi:MAG: hypothetical protein KHX03_09820 [Clostridium sp.]|nr:hypothetical protein [Clostridium sp.]
MPSMDEDIAKYPVFMVNKNGALKRIDLKSTDDYNHWEFELHHFIPKSLRKTDLKRYDELEHLQKLILLPKNIHHTLHMCSENFNYNGLKWWQLLFSRKQWRNGVYESRTGNELVSEVSFKDTRCF